MVIAYKKLLFNPLVLSIINDITKFTVKNRFFSSNKMSRLTKTNQSSDY